MRELKALPGHIKAISGRTVTGVFSVFGNIDQYNDKIWPGAFSKTISERGSKIFHLWQHDFGCPPIAVIRSLREIPREELPSSVLQVAPEAMGGAEVVREYLETPRAEEVLTNLKAGAPLQMSFAFDTVKYDFEELPEARYDWEHLRNIREVRLWETSDVLWGANEATVASKAHLPLTFLMKQLQAALDEWHDRKAGARHSDADTKLINSAHKLIVDLGCTTCKGDFNDETEDAAKTQPAPDADASRAAETPALTPGAFAYKRQSAERALTLLTRRLSA